MTAPSRRWRSMFTPSAAANGDAVSPDLRFHGKASTVPAAEPSLADIVESAKIIPLYALDEVAPEPPLYAASRKIYPQSVNGTFRCIKWAVLYLTLGIYYLLPFVRWDRGPDAPGQAVLVDFPNGRFYFFFIELWPQE